MAKNIIFCADGTWNDPNQDDNSDGLPDQTNVYKLFLALSGEFDAGTLRSADEQEKHCTDGNGGITQIAKYIHGVGDSKNQINKIMGGAFGAGVISRIVRGYTFISRNYLPGDNIYIIGFSRGAYTARALAGLICSQGLLSTTLANDRDKGQAYRYGAEAWYRYRQTLPNSHNILVKLAEIIGDLPAFISSGTLNDSNFVPVDRITAVGVWDTVGAMGVPDYHHGANHDSFRFADTTLNSKVAHGFHAVALDEQREVFSPTLWDAAPNVTQVLFPGAHADVGGGYPVKGNQSGLSDCPLEWMVGQMSNAGMLFTGATPTPDPGGVAHQPWEHAPWNTLLFPHRERDVQKVQAVCTSVTDRMALTAVVPDPDKKLEKYAPRNLPKNLMTVKC